MLKLYSFTANINASSGTNSWNLKPVKFVTSAASRDFGLPVVLFGTSKAASPKAIPLVIVPGAAKFKM